MAQVIPNILETIATAEADAFVLSCFSDPGIARARAATAKPVTGIAESAYLGALSLGRRFGIISLGPSSIARHLRYLQALDLHHRLAGDRSIDMTVVQLMATDVVETVARTARLLRDEDKADVIILGCAGLVPIGRHCRTRLAFRSSIRCRRALRSPPIILICPMRGNTHVL